MLHTDPCGRIRGPLVLVCAAVMQCRTAMSKAEPVVCGARSRSLRGTRSRRLDYCLLALAVPCVRVLRLGGSRSGNGIHCAGQTPGAGSLSLAVANYHD
jgi:hypothetical protein